MTYITYCKLSELKTYLKITDDDNTNDVLLSNILQDSYNQLNTILGVDTFNETEHIEDIDIIYGDGVFFTKNRPVSELKEINGMVYNGVLNTDYIIQYNRKLMVSDISIYLANLSFPVVKVKYIAGYNRDEDEENNPGDNDTLPNDIKLLHKMLASGMYYKVKSGDFGNVQSYRLGEESITFGGGNAGTNPDYEFYSFKTLLSNYQKGNVL